MTHGAGRASARYAPMHMRKGNKKLPHVACHVHFGEAGQISDEIPALHKLKNK